MAGGVRVTVVDHGNPGGSFTIYDGVRSVFLSRAGEKPTIGTLGDLEATGHYVRAGTGMYAGQTCTVWRRKDEHSTSEACVTAGRLMLRGSIVLEHEGQTQTGGLEATRLEYGPQDPARFHPPEGYRLVPPRTAAPPAAAPSGP